MAWAYVHPAAAALVVILLFYVGAIGLRARTDRRQRVTLLATHRRLGPILFALMLASWTGGLLSTWLLRTDLPLFGTTHLRIGTVLLAAMTGAWVTSRYMGVAAVRAAHPWFGAAAMLLAAAQVFFGLQITP